MKKLIGLLILSLLIAGCGSPTPVENDIVLDEDDAWMIAVPTGMTVVDFGKKLSETDLKAVGWWVSGAMTDLRAGKNYHQLLAIEGQLRQLAALERQLWDKEMSAVQQAQVLMDMQAVVHDEGEIAASFNTLWGARGVARILSGMQAILLIASHGETMILLAPFSPELVCEAMYPMSACPVEWDSVES